MQALYYDEIVYKAAHHCKLQIQNMIFSIIQEAVEDQRPMIVNVGTLSSHSHLSWSTLKD